MASATTKRRRYAYEPDYAVPPGQTLLETIQSLGIPQRELAERLKLSGKHVNQIIKGVAPITHETAIGLERVTGVPVSMWNNLEANYREQLARIEEKERLQQNLNWLKKIPVKHLVQRGVVEETRDKVAILEQVLEFFGVASVEAWEQGWQRPQFAFRKASTIQDKDRSGKIAVWLCLCERQAQSFECTPYQEARFRSALQIVRHLTVETPDVFIPKMQEECRQAGVAVVLEPAVPGASVSGASKWLTPDKAMIGLTLRGKRDDLFWFTFFHEAGHLLNDSKKETYIDSQHTDDPREQRANEFAANFLIPKKQAKSLEGLGSDRAKIIPFAETLGIAPGIVVGRMQYEGIIPHNRPHLNSLKVPLEWSEK